MYFLFCSFLFDLILYIKVTFFQSCRDRSPWVEPVLSRAKCLAQGHNLAPPVRLEPATPQSQVKNSTTEPPSSSLLIY